MLSQGGLPLQLHRPGLPQARKDPSTPSSWVDNKLSLCLLRVSVGYFNCLFTTIVWWLNMVSPPKSNTTLWHQNYTFRSPWGTMWLKFYLPISVYLNTISPLCNITHSINQELPQKRKKNISFFPIFPVFILISLKYNSSRNKWLLSMLSIRLFLFQNVEKLTFLHQIWLPANWAFVGHYSILQTCLSVAPGKSY